MLSGSQIERYSRQILLARCGGIGQLRLLAARLVLVGDGPVARTAATYLAAAGIGMLDVRRDEPTAPSSAPWSSPNPDCRLTFDAPSDGLPDLVAHTTKRVSFEPTAVVRRVVAQAAAGRATVIDAGQSCESCALRALGEVDARATRSTAFGSVTEDVAGALLAQEVLTMLLAQDPACRRRVVIDAAGAGSETIEASSPLCPHGAHHAGCDPQ